MHTQRQIFTTGETVFDIIFQNNRPKTGNPGGSVLNSAVTLGRLGLNPVFLSDFCDDIIGKVIKDFLEDNGVFPKRIISDDNKQTSVALAFLDENKNAKYEFYKQKPSLADDKLFTADFKQDDVLLFGSFYGIMPEIRSGIFNLLTKAKNCGSVIVYDPNFRKPHLKDLPKVFPYIVENLQFADIVKGSDEDFALIFSSDNDEKTFKELEKINPDGHFFLTKGKNGCAYYYKGEVLNFSVPEITPVSTVGAGDNFNAGIVYGIIKHEVTKIVLSKNIDKTIITDIVETSVKFSQEVCKSNENYISKEFAKRFI
ncbi:MAG: carbohydrate kinase [Bacteroidales bacterium]|nr:carbohydrate kinase [Bacteroidales bacterium]